MTLSRRRFLTLSACALAAPAHAETARWRGYAFGAEVSLDLFGAQSDADIAAVVSQVRAIEARFSIYDPASEVSVLNARGHGRPSAEMHELLGIAGRVHRATGGLFDPTIQPLWEALVTDGDTAAARRSIGFDRLDIREGRIALAPGQKLSFNGIAQGYATDRIARLLAARGYGKALINIGELAALGGPFRIGLDDVSAGQLGHVSLGSGALATSSPGAMTVGGQTHILHPKGGAALWSTVAVEAPSAALADACSTAFCLMPRTDIEIAKRALGLARVFLVDGQGDLSQV